MDHTIPEELARTYNRRARQARKRAVRKQKIIILCLFLLIGWGVAMGVHPKEAKPTVQEAGHNGDAGMSLARSETQPEMNAVNSSGDWLADLAVAQPAAKTILDNREAYPEEVLKMLRYNTETLPFVLKYQEKKGQLGEQILAEDIVPGEIPLLLQWDERWGYGMYGDLVLATNGCGPTCIAMIAAGLTGEKDITPYTVAQYSDRNGFVTAEGDTKWELMAEGCMEFGILGTMLGLDEAVMAQTLENGSPVICSVGPGDFTNNGHFIVLTGYQDGKFKVNDPNSRERSERLWSYQELADQIVNMWYYQVI